MNKDFKQAQTKKWMARAYPIYPVCLAGAALAAGITTGGCGSTATSRSNVATGSIASLGTGRASIAIHWPSRNPVSGRLIPVAANSIVVQMVRPAGSPGNTTGADQVVQSQTLARPTGDAPLSNISFSNLPLGTLSVVATSYPKVDGTGTAQATGSSNLTISNGKTTNFSVTMSSTIDHLTITPASSTLNAGTNKTLPLTATAYDATGAVVLLTPGKLKWSAAGAASVDGSGVVTAGSAAGTATITVTDSESGKSASSVLTVLLPAPQFTPNGADYAGTTTVTDGSGGWVATGDAYAFNTSANPPTLTDTTKNTLVAAGKLVTQTFGQVRTSVTYAVFDFPKDISLSGKSQITGTGTNPIVLLTQGNFTLGGGASISVSASDTIPGPGGAGVAAGPGAGGYSKGFYSGLNNEYPATFEDGGRFGGTGGAIDGEMGAYGADFDDAMAPHLQGGSGGYAGSAGGGALYIATVGLLSVNGASISATGGTPATSGGGGSGGGIALFGGGGVTFTSATIDASGGTGKLVKITSTTSPLISYAVGFGGDGGRVTIGYGASTPAPDISFITVSGGGDSVFSFAPKPTGVTAGVKSVESFAGF